MLGPENEVSDHFIDGRERDGKPPVSNDPDVLHSGDVADAIYTTTTLALSKKGAQKKGGPSDTITTQLVLHHYITISTRARSDHRGTALRTS